MMNHNGHQTLTNLKNYPDIIGQKVTHKAFGEGTITGIADTTLFVQFKEKTTKFQFPDAIGVWLTLNDSDKAAEVADFNSKNTVSREIKSPQAASKPHYDCVFRRAPEGWPHKKKASRSNAAFKLNYCNGGKTALTFGFNGVCSEAIIRYNIEKEHRVWCSNPYCNCRRFFDGKISYKKLLQICGGQNYPCQESIALRDWVTFAGADANGDPRKFRGAVVNKLGIFTTVPPNEKERIIFGAFMMQEIFEGDDDNGGVIRGNRDYCLELTPKEARTVRFWDYYENPNTPEKHLWGSGLVRYFDDDTAVKILQAMLDAKEDKEGKNKARRLLSRYCEANNIAMEQEIGKEIG